MGRTKRMLSLLLMLTVLLCSLTVQAFAAKAQFVACNTVTGVQYSTVATALAEAKADQTVQLLENAEESVILVPAGAVLDLNGKELTATYLTSYGNVVDSSKTNTGLLCVPAKRIYLRQDNTQMPINTAKGYRFVQINKFNEALVSEEKYVFDFRPEEVAHALLLAGADVSDVTLQVKVTWTQGKDTRQQVFTYNDRHLKEFIASYNAETGKYGSMFALTLSGSKGLQDLTFCAQLGSELGVEQGAAGLVVPTDGFVTTDENNQVTGEVTVTGDNAFATVSTGTQLEEDTTILTLNTTALEKGSNKITVAEGEETRSVDVHVVGVAESNTVPILVTMEAFAPKYMNGGNLTLYHVEDGVPVKMTRVGTPEEADVHNEFYYDVETGDVVMALASFSEVTAVVDTNNPWEGNLDYSWYDANEKELYIFNADQLAGFGAIVGEMATNEPDIFGNKVAAQDSFAGKTVKLMANISIRDTNSENGWVFYPVGYWNDDFTYAKTQDEGISSGFYSFEGTFDGNGNTISDFYQNTWEMKGDHNWYAAKDQHYRDGMGLFGKVYGGTVKNLTVKNFTSDGEIATTGVIAAYADAGATFENISIFNCNPRVYNIGNGGIVGCVGWYYKQPEGVTPGKVTFRNITVDGTNKISALWGSWDVPCGGIVGQYYHHSGQTGSPANAGIHFENCRVSAEIDVNNDVCANYQYYQYRYAGMLIGTVREVTKVDGKTVPNTTNITAENCIVSYDTWNEYWYCELVANSPASYTHDFQFSRLTRIESENDIKDENGAWDQAGNFVKKNADGTATCYHIVKDEDGVTLKRHLHTEAGTETFDLNKDGLLDDKEDRVRYLMPFKQLISGNSGYATYTLTEFPGVTVEEKARKTQKKFVDNFSGDNNPYYTNDEEIRLNKLFTLADGVDKSSIHVGGLSVFVSPVNENDTDCTFTYNVDIDHWDNGTLTIHKADGPVKVTITDYYYCESTEIVLYPAKETVGMYQRVTSAAKVLVDSFRKKDNVNTDATYAVVAQVGDVYYALGENGAHTKVNVSGDYITDIKGVPGWILGCGGAEWGKGTGFISLKSNTANSTYYLSNTLTGSGTEVACWKPAEDANKAGNFTLSTQDGTQVLGYKDGAFGVYAADTADATVSLRLYQLISATAGVRNHLPTTAKDIVYLSDMAWKHSVNNGGAAAVKDVAWGGTNTVIVMGDIATNGGTSFEKGLGVQPYAGGESAETLAHTVVDLKDNGYKQNTFYACAGITNNRAKNSAYQEGHEYYVGRGVYFAVYASYDKNAEDYTQADFKLLEKSEMITKGNVHQFHLDVTGVRYLKLVVYSAQNDISNMDCNWAGACVYNNPGYTPKTDMIGSCDGTTYDNGFYVPWLERTADYKTYRPTMFNAVGSPFNTYRFRNLPTDAIKLATKTSGEGSLRTDFAAGKKQDIDVTTGKVEWTDTPHFGWTGAGWVGGTHLSLKAQFPEKFPDNDNHALDAISQKDGIKFPANSTVYFNVQDNTDKDGFVEYDVSTLDEDTFYCIVGAVNQMYKQTEYDPKNGEGSGMVFEVWGKFTANGEYTLLAESEPILKSNSGEFLVDITNVHSLKLRIRMRDPKTHAHCYATGGFVYASVFHECDINENVTPAQ